MTSHQGEGFGVIFGLLFCLAALAVVGLQGFWFLQDGQWYPITLMDVFARFSSNAWISTPTEWLGVHKILSWMPLSGTLFCFGILVVMGDS